MSKVRIYACGGTGIAIGKKVTAQVPAKGAAVPKIVYCDTSDSDMLTGFEKDDKYVLKNVDGAGRLQREHLVPIRKSIPELLAAHEPLDLNIIIASSSGGTGSTYSTELAKQLASEGHPTIVHLVVTQEDARATQNSSNTLKNFNYIATKSGVPIVLDIVRQLNASDEAKSDDAVIRSVTALLIAAGGQNKGLDTRDVYNFVNFNRVTDVKPRILMLDVILNDPTDETLKREDAVTLLEVTPNGEVPSNMSALYSVTGEGLGKVRIILLTHAGNFSEVVQDLSVTKEIIKERLETLAAPAIELGDEDEDSFYE